jgi:hypothetical protein
MFTRCIFCHANLPANDLVERFPLGRRIAFDPGRGRLWVVCSECRRWNLAPIEERWEALEDLEKVVRDKGRVLSQTDNIALMRAGETDFVRVGNQTKLVEEAWWRYSRELRERRSRHSLVSYVEMGVLVSASLVMGGAWWFYGGNAANDIRRWRQFGKIAWRGELKCSRCHRSVHELKFAKTKEWRVAPDAENGFALELTCSSCRTDRRPAPERGVFRIEGVTAQHTLRRALAWHHFSGASEKRVREATAVIENAGTAHQFARTIADRALSIDKLKHKTNRTDAIALEIALNDDVERRMLELELEELEARWREEEELASIVDGELTPLPALEKLRRWINPAARPRDAAPDGER